MSTGRSYASERRSAQAADTRRRIAGAARALFIERGFGTTTIDAIAAAAGVAPATVYAVFKTKRAILLQLLDDWEADADIAARRAAVAASADDARAQLRHDVEWHVRFFTRGADLVAAVRAAGPADPTFDALRVEGEARRRAWHEPLVRAWARGGKLRARLSEEEATDVLFVMSGDRLYDQFVRELGWPTERYAEWLYRTLERLLLADEST